MTSAFSWVLCEKQLENRQTHSYLCPIFMICLYDVLRFITFNHSTIALEK